MNTNESTPSDVLSYLMEVAKTGNLPDVTDLRHWMPDLEIHKSASQESVYYQVLSAQMLIEKGATEPLVEVPEFTEPPATEDLRSISLDIVDQVKECLVYKDWTLLEEILRIVKSQSKILHPMTLPLLLDHCQNQFKLHRLLQQVMGKRSLWLAPMQDRWNWWVEINQTDINLISPENQLAWISIQYENGQTNLENLLTKLSAKDKKTTLELLANQPRPADELIARDLISSKSTSLQYLANVILLKLNTQERKEIQKIVGEFCKKYIVNKNGKINFGSKSIIIEEKIDFKLLNLFEKENNGRHPFFGIIELYPPDFIYQHLSLSQEEIIRQLIMQKDLKDLLQITINSAANFCGQTNFGKSLVLRCIKNYPQGNAAEIKATALLEKLSPDEIQSIIEALLLNTNDEYFIQKINIIVSGIEHYIKKELSIKLVERIFQFIGFRLSRTDTNHLLEVLPHLQYVLDPRAYGTVISHWQEVDYRQQKLGETLGEFRNIMKLRHQILNTIID